MYLGKVIGQLILSKAEPSLEGQPLLIVETLDEDLKPYGEPIIAVDVMGAGNGEIVLMVKGKESVGSLPEPHPPTDYGINAIIDEVYVVKEIKKKAKRKR